MKSTKTKTKSRTKTTSRRKTKKRTNIAIVLDSSGSMSSMRTAAIELFNSQRNVILKNAKKGGDTKVSLVVFGEDIKQNISNVNIGNNFTFTNTWLLSGGGVRVVHENLCADCIPELTEQNYHPQSSTPMRDGIGTAINLLQKEDDCGKDTAFLVIIITDGYENSSREWTAEALSKKIVDLQNTGRWTFAVYGCSDLDLSELKSTSGLDSVWTNNVGTYTRGNKGLLEQSIGMASSTATYFAGRSVGVTNTTSFVTKDKDIIEDENIK